VTTAVPEDKKPEPIPVSSDPKVSKKVDKKPKKK
jgi:hypothetical protein